MGYEQNNSYKLIVKGKMQTKWVAIVLALVIFGIGGWFYFNKNVNDNYEGNMDTTNYTYGSNTVVLKTNLGDIEIELFKDEVPNTVANFVKLSNDGFYNGTKFHRVIKDFMIQGGDPNSKGDDKSVYGFGGPGYKFDDEPYTTKLERGIVAMANSGPNTNGSQFFIITAPETPWLQGKHTAFGRVVGGMDVVDKIENTPVGQNDIPVTPVVIESVEFK